MPNALSGIPGFTEAATKLADGKSTSAGSQRTFLDLPFTQEFRGQIIEASVKKSQAGNPGIGWKLEITDDGGDGQYVGQYVWGNVYFTGHEFQGQQLALLLATQPEGASAGTLEEAADVIVGGSLVFALKPNNGGDARYPQIRYMNVDRGQALNLNVKPPKDAATPAAIQADISAIRQNAASKQQTANTSRPTPVEASPQAQPDPPQATEEAPRPAPKLPGGGMRLPGVR